MNEENQNYGSKNSFNHYESHDDQEDHNDQS